MKPRMVSSSVSSVRVTGGLLVLSTYLSPDGQERRSVRRRDPAAPRGGRFVAAQWSGDGDDDDVTVNRTEETAALTDL